MKKLLACVLLTFLVSSFFTTTTRYVYAADDACSNLPKIPISVDPTTGTQATEFKVTLHWEQMSPADVQTYSDQYDLGYRVGVYASDKDGNPAFLTYPLEYPQADIDPNNPTPATQGLTGATIEGEQDISIHIGFSEQCIGLEKEAKTIHVNANALLSPSPSVAQGPTENSKCIVSQQTDNNFKCQGDTVCVRVNGDGGICQAPSAPPATDTPPQPPCASPAKDKDGAFIGCGAVNTGLGISFDTDPQKFIVSLFTFLLSISGGILLIFIIMSGYQMMVSQGDPEKIKAARERLTSAMIGFAFLVFSLVILEVIGVDILHIPGFCGHNDYTCETQINPAPTSAPFSNPPASTAPAPDVPNCGETDQLTCNNKYQKTHGCKNPGAVASGHPPRCVILGG